MRCAHCNDHLIAPEWTGYRNERHARHPAVPTETLEGLEACRGLVERQKGIGWAGS